MAGNLNSKALPISNARSCRDSNSKLTYSNREDTTKIDGVTVSLDNSPFPLSKYSTLLNTYHCGRGLVVARKSWGPPTR